MATVLIGLGSNRGPEWNLREAARLLRERFPQITFSHVYRTAPRDVEDQPDFLNAVARVRTNCRPDQLLAELQRIERALGKLPPYRFGPRTIDLDLLLYNAIVLPSGEEWKMAYEQLAVGNAQCVFVPHLHMHERRFVLEPLCELLDPQTLHPTIQRPWSMLLTEATDQRCERIDLVL